MEDIDENMSAGDNKQKVHPLVYQSHGSFPV